MEEDILLVGGNRTNMDYPPMGHVRKVTGGYGDVHRYDVEGLEGDMEAQAGICRLPRLSKNYRVPS